MRQDNMPLHTRRKRCKLCKRLFEPDPRAKGRQQYCSKPACQARRQRQNEYTWRMRNPDCLDYQRGQSRLWYKARPQYSRNRRLQDSCLLQDNRDKTRLRMRKIRVKMMFDKSKLILTQLVERQADKCLLTRRSRWLMVRLTKASPLSKLLLMTFRCVIRN